MWQGKVLFIVISHNCFVSVNNGLSYIYIGKVSGSIVRSIRL